MGVLVAPVIPFLTDHQIEPVLEAAWEHGARQAGYVLMRLPWEVKDLFRDWLERNYPLEGEARDEPGARDARRARQRPRFRQPHARRGRTGASCLRSASGQACARLGFNDSEERNRALDTTQFRAPARTGQLSLFGDE